MGNLDWVSKFLLDMSQNRGQGKKVHCVVRNKFGFWPINPLFYDIDQKLRTFFLSYNFYKTQNSQF